MQEQEREVGTHFVADHSSRSKFCTSPVRFLVQYSGLPSFYHEAEKSRGDYCMQLVTSTLPAEYAEGMSLLPNCCYPIPHQGDRPIQIESCKCLTKVTVIPPINFGSILHVYQKCAAVCHLHDPLTSRFVELLLEDVDQGTLSDRDYTAHVQKAMATMSPWGQGLKEVRLDSEQPSSRCWAHQPLRLITSSWKCEECSILNARFSMWSQTCLHWVGIVVMRPEPQTRLMSARKSKLQPRPLVSAEAEQ
jgi:hypothetical protein